MCPNVHVRPAAARSAMVWWSGASRRPSSSPASSRSATPVRSVDPQVVGDAAVICAQLAHSAHPGLGPLLDALPSEPPAPASADLRRATGLLTRVTGYLEKAGSLTPSSGSGTSAQAGWPVELPPGHPTSGPAI